MAKPKKTSLMFHLEMLQDPWSGENYRHRFIEILFIGVCVVISGCECMSAAQAGHSVYCTSVKRFGTKIRKARESNKLEFYSSKF